MNASLFASGRAERFAQLMDEATGARRHHAHSKLDEELGELVSTGRRLRAMRLNGIPTDSFKQDLRVQLLATAEREGIGVTALPPPNKGLGRKLSRPRLSAARPRARGAIVVGVAAGTLALSGVSVASGEAIPGDALYGMKRSTEKAQLALAGSELSRGQLYLEFARTRRLEAEAVRLDEAGFVGSLRDMDADTRQGIRMLITSAISQRDTTALDVVDRFVAAQRMLVAEMLDTSSDLGRHKVTESLELLTAAEQRATSARAALACDAPSLGSDGLGPILGTCGDFKTESATPEAGKVPVQTHPGPPIGPSTVASGPAATVQPSGTAEAQQKDDGLLGELGRILGGLLGG